MSVGGFLVCILSRSDWFRKCCTCISVHSPVHSLSGLQFSSSGGLVISLVNVWAMFASEWLVLSVISSVVVFRLCSMECLMVCRIGWLHSLNRWYWVSGWSHSLHV